MHRGVAVCVGCKHIANFMHTHTHTHLLTYIHTHQLFVVNTVNNSIFDIPHLKLEGLDSATTACGIHAISASNERTYLATGGADPTHLAIYSLPELQPLAIGKVYTYMHPSNIMYILCTYMYCRDTQTGSLTYNGSQTLSL